jgi:hypothetical protein
MLKVRAIFNVERNDLNVNKKALHIVKGFSWSHLGSNQGQPDYESGTLTS